MRVHSFLVLMFLSILAFVVNGQSIPEKRCTPYSTFYKLCNTCRCNGDGTDMICSEFKCPSRYKKLKKNRICVPGERFKKGCRICMCNDYGTDAECSLKTCM